MIPPQAAAAGVAAFSRHATTAKAKLIAIETK
jgi:hypothetical protein